MPPKFSLGSQEAQVVDFIPHDGQKQVLQSPKRFVFAMGGNRGGKAIQTSEMLQTPAGFIQAKYIKTGDTLYGVDGHPTKVLGVYPQGVKKLWKFIFDDGASLVVDTEHLWATMGAEERFRKTTRHGNPNKNYQKWVTRSTQEIMDIYNRYPEGAPAKQRIIIPVAQPIRLPRHPVTIDPYALGLLIGNGCFNRSGSITYSTIDQDTLEAFDDYVFVSRINYRIRGMADQVKGLGLDGKRSWEKHIPTQYLVNDIETRTAILQGLMDTDGYADSRGHLSYSTASEQLARDVQYLVRSLGGKATITVKEAPTFSYKGEKKTGRPSYNVNILTIGVQPFRITRKLNRYIAGLAKKASCPHRILKKIECYGEGEAVCFEVDSEYHLYVATDFIVTHNTTVGCYWAYLQMQRENTNGLIGANVYDQLNHSVLTKFFEIFPQLERFYVKRDKMMVLPGNRKVFFRSLDEPGNLKGLNLHWEWVDEGDGLDEESWFVLRSRVATTQGRILITSSIYPDSWIYDAVYKKGQTDYELITWESRDNPSFPKEEWERLKRETDPIRFAREYESKFSFAAGRVYSDILSYGVVETNTFPEGSVPLVWFFGLDFGVADPTAIVVMSYNSDGCWYIVDEYYQPNLKIEEINHWLSYFIGKYDRPMLTIMDYAGGVAKLSVTPVANPYDTVSKNIAERVSLVRDLIHRRQMYVFRRCTNTIREFSYYSFHKTKTDKPEDKNNHSMDALGYVIHTASAMVEGMADRAAHKEEELDGFWLRKKEQGIYKGDGKLEDRVDSGFDSFFGGDEW